MIGSVLDVGYELIVAAVGYGNVEMGYTKGKVKVGGIFNVQSTALD